MAAILVIPNATHVVYLDRPEHGRKMLLTEIVNFVRSASASCAGTIPLNRTLTLLIKFAE
jgi:hypothetical protein